MKVQCNCGAKYAFDATPEMVRNPIKFSCPSCKADISAQMNELIRQQFASAPAAAFDGLAPAKEIAPPPPYSKFVAPPVAAPTPQPTPPPAPKISIQLPQQTAPSVSAPPAPSPSVAIPSVAIPATPKPVISVTPPAPAPIIQPAIVSSPQPIAPAPVVPHPPVPISSPLAPPPPPPPLPPTGGAVRISRTSAPQAGAATPDVQDTRFCTKHPQMRVTETCRFCEKPICPKCMELFGYVCSVHCREKAEANGIEIPIFAGQRDVAQRKSGRKANLIVGCVALTVVALLAFWIWYAWIASRPSAAFAVRFEDDPAISGMSEFCPDNQIVFVHGGKLARYDLGSKKQVWLNQIVDKKKIGEEAAAAVKRMQEQAAQSEYTYKVPSVENYTQQQIRWAEESLELMVHDKNIWVASGKKVVRYDWDSGQPKQELAFNGGFRRAKRIGDEMETREQFDGKLAITRFNLTSGNVKNSEIVLRAPVVATTNSPASTNKNAKVAAATKPGGKPAADPNARKQLNPQEIAAALGNASYAAKIAAPATISAAINQQRALNFMDEMDGVQLPPGVPKEDAYKYRNHSEIIARREGVIRFSYRMLEEKIIARDAMKAAPKKSALEGNVNAAATMDIANELLNEMQRNADGGKVREDHSRYLVRIFTAEDNSKPAWEGEVTGEPSIFPQPSVTVIAAGKSLIVLDKSHKKKWESTLNYPVGERYGFASDDEGDETSGLGPIVERGETLFVADKGVLSAFELASGNARWRLPSVGISSMFFDDKGGAIYINTSSASPESIKYSKQIDVANRTSDVILKLDATNGKELWSVSSEGTISHLEDKFIYTVSYVEPLGDDEELNPDLAALGIEKKPYVRIRRINPKNGQIMWDHFQQRGPVDVKIHKNVFQIVFKKEVQVLKFVSF
jgi:hypothetical protein